MENCVQRDHFDVSRKSTNIEDCKRMQVESAGPAQWHAACNTQAVNDLHPRRVSS